ncbi:hypothetical protein FB458_2350 [Lapillicoccus jejuensis]|uniref:Uncharacterized protein n=1 Tax=Lapillicoccus jejuensis TaxID=402171 RepID=A0A542E1M2_9MICO|nr:hypothetical protein FB458_2350 [Lapillicoccus jejuensis]
MAAVRQRIDLDAAAEELRRRAASWRENGLHVGDLTWADGQTTVHPVTTDRGAVRGDYSVGVAVRRGEREGILVLYGGGWCDLIVWSGRPGDAAVDEVPGWQDWLDLQAFSRVVDRFEALLLE